MAFVQADVLSVHRVYQDSVLTGYIVTGKIIDDSWGSNQHNFSFVLDSELGSNAARNFITRQIKRIHRAIKQEQQDRISANVGTLQLQGNEDVDIPIKLILPEDLPDGD